MAYIRKKYRRLLEISDKQFTIPKSFASLVERFKRLHNLVIKGKNNECWCTFCNHHFVSETKVNGMTICPNCKTKLLVKTKRLTHFEFKDNLQLLDKLEDVLVLRIFELYTSFDGTCTKHSLTEFMRTFIEDDDVKDFVTNQVHNHMGYMYIAHYQDFEFWRYRNYRWAYRDVIGKVDAKSVKRQLKNTTLKYSQLDKFIAKQDYVDFIRYYRLAHYKSFELLIKAKLFELAKNADRFIAGNNFQEIFGVSKSFLPFMQKNNISYNQLEILRLINKEDIKLIKQLSRFDIYYLEKLSKFVDLEEAYKKVLGLKENQNNVHEYLDYLEAARFLKLPLHDKKVLYPSNLLKEHDKLIEQVQIVENAEHDKLIQKRLEDLNKNVYKNNKYIVFPAPSAEALLKESKEQHNCVFKSYLKKYCNSLTDIYFLRKVDSPNKSFVTVEVNNNRVVQAKAKYNEDVSKETQKFLDKWERKLQKVAIR